MISRSLGISLGVCALALCTAFAQEPKKSDPSKPRLPNNWRPLDLTEEQKEKYYRLAKERDDKMTSLKGEMQKLRSKLSQMKKDFDELDTGDAYLAILTPSQKEKLAVLKAESAKKTAEKAAKKAKDLASGKNGKAPAEDKKKPKDGEK